MEADALHYVTDLAGNGMVLLALVLAEFGLHWADPVAGLLIAAWLLWSAWEISSESVGVLLDRELEAEERTRILSAAQGVEGVLGVAGLRTRQAGGRKFVELALELDSNLRLYRCHVITSAVRAELQTLFPGADVVVHFRPYGAEEARERAQS